MLVGSSCESERANERAPRKLEGPDRTHAATANSSDLANWMRLGLL